MTPAGELNAILRDFHSYALSAWMIVAAEPGRMPPDWELTWRLAYDLYGADLRRKSLPPSSG